MIKDEGKGFLAPDKRLRVKDAVLHVAARTNPLILSPPRVEAAHGCSARRLRPIPQYFVDCAALPLLGNSGDCCHDAQRDFASNPAAYPATLLRNSDATNALTMA